MKKVALLLADGFEEVEAVTPVDFLRRAGVEVVICTIDKKLVTGSHGIVIQTDCSIDLLGDDLDGIILPGGMPGATNLGASEAVVSLIHKMNNSNKLVAAICAAPAVVLGGAGLLEGRQFTCYPGFETEVIGAHFSTERVVQDGNFISSRGPGTAAEFSIAVIAYLVGSDVANSVKEETLQNC